MTRRAMLLVSLASVLGFGLLVTAHSPLAAAQDATPSASNDQLPPGVTSDFIAFGQATALPPVPGAIAVFRLTLQPGADLPPDSADPSAAFVIVESGKVVVHDATALTVGHSSSEATPEAENQTFEQIPADTDATLEAGDSAFGGPNVAIELRNDGDVPAVLLVVVIAPADNGGAAGTPTA